MAAVSGGSSWKDFIDWEELGYAVKDSGHFSLVSAATALPRPSSLLHGARAGVSERVAWTPVPTSLPFSSPASVTVRNHGLHHYSEVLGKAALHVLAQIHFSI